MNMGMFTYNREEAAIQTFKLKVCFNFFFFYSLHGCIKFPSLVSMHSIARKALSVTIALLF